MDRFRRSAVQPPNGRFSASAPRAYDHLFGRRHPGRFGLIVGEPGGGLQRLLVSVQNQIPFAVFLGSTHGAERNSNVFVAHAEEPADANDHCSDTTFLVDKHVIDVTDLVVRRILDSLLIEISHGGPVG